MTSGPGMSHPFGQIQIIGIGWYLQKDYPEILRIMTDADRLPQTFKVWQHQADQLERGLIAQGKTVIRAIIDPATFPEWCRRHGLNVDAKGRMAFANERAYLHGRV